MWDRRCKIERVKDGDTIVTYEDCGKQDYEQTDVRLFGVYAPERGQPGFDETTEFAVEWIKVRDNGDWPWVITYMRNKSNTREQETFGRYVCMVHNAVTGEYLNAAIAAFVIEKGYPRGTGG